MGLFINKKIILGIIFTCINIVLCSSEKLVCTTECSAFEGSLPTFSSLQPDDWRIIVISPTNRDTDFAKSASSSRCSLGNDLSSRQEMYADSSESSSFSRRSERGDVASDSSLSGFHNILSVYDLASINRQENPRNNEPSSTRRVMALQRLVRREDDVRFMGQRNPTSFSESATLRHPSSESLGTNIRNLLAFSYLESAFSDRNIPNANQNDNQMGAIDRIKKCFGCCDC